MGQVVLKSWRRFSSLTAITAIAALTVVTALSACGRTSPTSATQNIFGQDARVITPNSAPFTAIGRLDSGCTGTLIGHKLVLTAAHCVIDQATGTVQPGFTYFRPNLRGGTSSEQIWIDYAWVGNLKPEDNRTGDWAILRLTKPVGDTYGKIAIHDPAVTAASLPYLTNLVGYSDDLNNGDNPTAHFGCYVFQLVDGKLYHGCDGASGVSGGPLLNQINGNWYIVGITVSEFRQGAAQSVTRDQWSADYANVGIPATDFLTATNTLLQTADVGITAPTIAGVTTFTNPNAVPTPTPGPLPPAGGPLGPANIVSIAALQANQAALQALMNNLFTDAQNLQQLAASTRTAPLASVATPLAASSGSLNLALGNVFAGRAPANYQTQLWTLFNQLSSNELALARLPIIFPPPQETSLTLLRSGVLSEVNQLQTLLFTR